MAAASVKAAILALTQAGVDRRSHQARQNLQARQQISQDAVRSGRLVPAESTSSISRSGLTGRQVWRALGIGDEGLCSLRMVVRVPRRAFALLSMPNFQT
jgi:hypothetical protein